MDTSLAEWLDGEDRANREERLSRLEWIASRMPEKESFSFHAGLTSFHLFEETRYCYVYGQFLATITLGMAYIEQSFAAIYYGRGRTDLGKAGSAELFREALEGGLISHADHSRLEKIRKTRIPITHFRPPLHEDTIEGKSVRQHRHPYKIIGDDAQFVMLMVLKMVGKLPPG
jgi:hypothetical protein